MSRSGRTTSWSTAGGASAWRAAARTTGPRTRAKRRKAPSVTEVGRLDSSSAAHTVRCGASSTFGWTRSVTDTSAASDSLDRWRRCSDAFDVHRQLRHPQRRLAASTPIDLVPGLPPSAASCSACTTRVPTPPTIRCTRVEVELAEPRGLSSGRRRARLDARLAGVHRRRTTAASTTGVSGSPGSCGACACSSARFSLADELLGDARRPGLRRLARPRLRRHALGLLRRDHRARDDHFGAGIARRRAPRPATAGTSPPGGGRRPAERPPASACGRGSRSCPRRPWRTTTRSRPAARPCPTGRRP